MKSENLIKCMYCYLLKNTQVKVHVEGNDKIFTSVKVKSNCKCNYRRDGVVVRASASQSVDLGFIPLVESYQKTLKNVIHSFPAWRSAFRGGCGEQAGKFACCVLGQGT